MKNNIGMERISAEPMQWDVLFTRWLTVDIWWTLIIVLAVIAILIFTDAQRFKMTHSIIVILAGAAVIVGVMVSAGWAK